MLFLSFLYCFAIHADSITGLSSGLGDVEVAARNFDDAARRYERNLQQQSQFMEQLRTRTEQYRALQAQYDCTVKYTASSTANALDRATIQQQIRETVTTLEGLNKKTTESYNNAMESGKKFRSLALKNKVNPYAGSMAHFINNPTARQIQYVLNGQALKVEASETVFRGLQMTQQMEKPKTIEKLPEKAVEIKVGLEPRTLNMKTGEYLVIKTTNEGLARVKIEGFTPNGQVVVRDVLPPAISNMSSRTPYVVDFTKVAEVTTFNSKQAPPLEMDVSGPKRQTLRIQPTMMQRLVVVQLQQFDKLKSPQMGNATNVVAPSNGPLGK